MLISGLFLESTLIHGQIAFLYLFNHVKKKTTVNDLLSFESHLL